METRPDYGGKATLYSGVLFRSQLESKWAMRMDEVGIVWEYEPLRYATGNYIPDFTIRDAHDDGEGGLAEVKPEFLYERLMHNEECFCDDGRQFCGNSILGKLVDALIISKRRWGVIFFGLPATATVSSARIIMYDNKEIRIVLDPPNGARMEIWAHLGSGGRWFKGPEREQ